MVKKAVYILVEDSRETGLTSGNGITGKICYSKLEACTILLKRIWFFEPSLRKLIEEKRQELGDIKAYKDVASWWYYCPVYVKRFIKGGTHD
jgi:hypothetical protein